jgi:hypothetical protein
VIIVSKQQDISDYIKKETGIIVSKRLLSFILNPQKLNTLNNKALKEIVIEFAPIYKAFRWTLDGPNYLGVFTLSLDCRITNKPELRAILGTDNER